MSAHLDTLRAMRAEAWPLDRVAAITHAIAVLEGCEALNRRALENDHVAVMGPSGEEPTWAVEDVEASSIEGAIAAYARSRR